MTTPAGGYDWTAIYRKPVEDEAPAAGVAGEKAGAPDADALAWMTGCSHDHAAEQRIFDMPDDVKLAACAVYKRTGNAYFREGCYDRALERYQRALIYYEYAFPDDPQRQFSMGRVRLTCLLNMVAAYIHLKRWSEAVGHAHQALSMVEELEALAPLVLRGQAAAGTEAPAAPAPPLTASGVDVAAAPAAACVADHGAATDSTGASTAATSVSEPCGCAHGSAHHSDSHGAGAAASHAPAAAAPLATSTGTASFLRSLLCTARAKALYRRAVARRHLDDYAEAAADLALASAASSAAASAGGSCAPGVDDDAAAAAAASAPGTSSSGGGVGGGGGGVGGTGSGIDPAIAREGRILARKRRAYERKTARIARIMTGTAAATAGAPATGAAAAAPTASGLHATVPTAAVAAEAEDDAADAAGDDDDDDAASVASDVTTGSLVASVGASGELPLVFDVDVDDDDGDRRGDGGDAAGAGGSRGGGGKGAGMTTAALLALR